MLKILGEAVEEMMLVFCWRWAVGLLAAVLVATSSHGQTLPHVNGFHVNSDAPFKANRAVGQQRIDTPLNPGPFKFMGVDRVHEELGVRGKGVVAGISSSGMDLAHPGLRQGYRGYFANNDTYDHNYNFWNPFPGAPQVPTDYAIAGSFTAGLISDATPGVGVAPDSKYIMCKAIDDLGYEVIPSDIACMEWLLSPRDSNYSNPRPDLRPDVVYLPICESCWDSFVLNRSLLQLRQAGIVVVTPAGYTATGDLPCGKIYREPANYMTVIAVGAHAVSADGTEALPCLETACGPPIVNGTLDMSLMKPDWVAPGVDIISTLMVNGVPSYYPSSGTVVSGAIATGLVALVLSSNPLLKRQVRAVEDILRHTSSNAVPGLPYYTCFQFGETLNFYAGYGVVNVYDAVLRAQQWPYGGCPILPLSAAECPLGTSGKIEIDHEPPRQCHETACASTETKRLAYTTTLAMGTSVDDFGDPNTDPRSEFRLCVYDSSIDPAYPLILNTGFKVKSNNWALSKDCTTWTWPKTSSTQSYCRWPKRGCPSEFDGIQSIRFDDSQLSVEGSGDDLPLSRVRHPENGNPVLPILKIMEMYQGLTVQFHSVHSNKCWGSLFTSTTENTEGRLRANY